MRYELFATDYGGDVVFLGTFGRTEHLLRALDQYEGMGYKKLKYCAI